MPMHRAARGGIINGADWISLAEPVQYALINVSSASHDFDGLPRRTRNTSAPGWALAAGPGSPCGPGGPRSPRGPAGPCSPCGPGRPRSPCVPRSPGGPRSPRSPGSPFGPCGPTGPGCWLAFLSTAPPPATEPWPSVVEVLLSRGVLANVSAILPTISWPTSAYKARQTPVPPAIVSSHAAHLVIPEHTKKMWKVGGREGGCWTEKRPAVPQRFWAGMRIKGSSRTRACCAARRNEDIGRGQRRVADTKKKAT